MKIGDLVRTLHDSEEGIVQSIQGGLVEVEVSDGFVIPYQKSELVLIDQGEKILGKEQSAIQKTEVPAKKVKAFSQYKSGIYLAVVSRNDQELDVHLLNLSGSHLMVSYHNPMEGSKGTRFRDQLNLGSMSQRKLERLNLNEVDHWPVFGIDVLYYASGTADYKSPQSFRYKLSAKKIFKQSVTLPVLEVVGAMFRIDEDVHALQALQTSNKASSKALPETEDPGDEIDLHYNMLPTSYRDKAGSELEKQLQYFQDTMDQCLKSNKDRIVFIHGVGAGVLKDAICKSLSKNKDIKHFKDAKKEKFGYGGTEVVFK